MLIYFVVCIGITGLFCIAVGYLYLAAADKDKEMSDISEGEPRS